MCTRGLKLLLVTVHEALRRVLEGCVVPVPKFDCKEPWVCRVQCRFKFQAVLAVVVPVQVSGNQVGVRVCCGV